MESIKPIINGKVNPNLTNELFNELPFETKKSVVWNIMVSMGFAHCFPGIDTRCYEKFSEEFKHSSIVEENVDDLFVSVKGKFKQHHDRMLAKTKDLHYELGGKIYKAQRELGFGGFIELDAYRLKGYLSEGGSWNDFNHRSVGEAITIIDGIAPRKDYGVNNPNTGLPMHTWKTNNRCEYVVLCYDFIGKEDIERIKSFYVERWEPLGRSNKADSVRIDVEQLDDSGTYFKVELIWWWD